jgi:small subunit ribosomal protein S9
MVKYYQGTGRRKTATARIRMVRGRGQITVNKKKVADYFSDFSGSVEKINQPLVKTSQKDKFDISVLARGGGKKGQLEAIQLGVARALISYDQKFKPTLKKEGLLTRDPRMKERKKPGLKRARRAAQWKKR